MTGTREPGIRSVTVRRISLGSTSKYDPDDVAVEEPLEIQVGFTDEARRARTLSITMRTPGQDEELAAGFLFTEGIIRKPSDVAAILTGRNSVRVELARDVRVEWPAVERHVYMASSCGICGKTSIDAVRSMRCEGLMEGPMVPGSLVASLPQRLRAAQIVFNSTGGLQAAALFDCEGNLLDLQEDVGRHNALDKLIGTRFLRHQLPLSQSVLVVSGRASFELVQKALAAGIPVMAAVGAPSSLAVDLAHDAGMTLAGFVRPGGFNLYCGESRVLEDA